MVNREFQNPRRYILAFVIGTMVFILGFIISYSFSYLEYQRISNLQQQTSYDIFQDKLEYSLFNEEICNNNSFKQISEDLGFQGQIINDLEKKFGKEDQKVLFRKQFYTLTELEHFEFVRTLNKKCKTNIDTILFFYSNEKEDLERSENVGALLDVVSRKNDNLMIYSFDINLESDLIKILRKRFGIEESPIIIINEKEKITNPGNIEEVEKLL